MNNTPPIASKWNARYAYATKDQPNPPAVLIEGDAFQPNARHSFKAGDSNATGIEITPTLATSSSATVAITALDLACGRGGAAIHLALKGYKTYAWDISDTVIASLKGQCAVLSSELPLIPEVRDVVQQPPEPNQFDVIVVSRFLDRSLCPFIVDALKPNGVLFYQTFLTGLSNKHYLLNQNELPELFSDLHQLHYRESTVNAEGFSEAFFVGRK